MYSPTRQQRSQLFPWLLHVSLGVLSASNFLGCAAKLQSVMIGSLIEDVARAAAEHNDPQLVVSGLPTFLLLLDGLLEANPDDHKLLIKATEAYTSYATLIEYRDPQRAGGLYLHARNYGLKALSQRIHEPERLQAPFSEFSQIFTQVKPEDLPAVFWTATSWAGWIFANTESMAALAELPKVIRMMQWVLQQDETFQHGSPHVFLGVCHAALPQMLGGNPMKAAEHFDRALAISQGQMLMIYVLKAKFYARQIFDRELYESLLNHALTSPVNGVAGLTLQNINAQQQARILLSQADDFF